MVLKYRKLLLAIADVAFVNLAFYIALLVRFDAAIPQRYIDCFIHNALIITVIHIGIFYVLGLYRSLWEYASIEEMMQIALSALVAGGLALVAGFVIGDRLPITVYFIGCILTCLFAGGSRLSYRYLRRVKKPGTGKVKKPGRVMIVGAGSAGSMIIKDLKNHKGRNLVPVVVVDDNIGKNGTRINGVPVRSGRNHIKELAKQYKIDEIIVAIPSAPRKDMAEILRLCKETGCRLRTLPELVDLNDGKVSIRDLRDVNIEDLLGRDEINLDLDEISGYLENETVLVTGGGGSIGSELCRQIARFGPKKLIIFDIYENNAYDLQHELMFSYKGKLDLEVLIGSCRDRVRLKEVFEKYSPGVVFHAAAHKHVPLMEVSPRKPSRIMYLGR